MNRWKLLASKPVLSTHWMTVSQNAYEIAPGKVLDDYFIVERADFALVVACGEGRLALVRQYRPATDKYYLALPAGFLRSTETPEDCAKRELREETGWRGEEFRVIGSLDPLPGYIRSRAHVVWCRLCESTGGVEDTEEIDESVLLPIKKVHQLVAQGEIDEMQAVSALFVAQSMGLLT